MSRVTEHLKRAYAELAELLRQSIPCLDLVRFTGSGTEATMHCLRLARAFTGHQKILRFEGNSHGYHDQVMWAADGPLGPFAPQLKPVSAGVADSLDELLIKILTTAPASSSKPSAGLATNLRPPSWSFAPCSS